MNSETRNFLLIRGEKIKIILKKEKLSIYKKEIYINSYENKILKIDKTYLQNEFPLIINLNINFK